MFTEPHEKNAFLSRLAASELALFRSHLAPLELRVGDSLHRAVSASTASSFRIPDW